MDFAILRFFQETESSEFIEQELIVVILLSIAALVAISSRRIRLPYTVALVVAGLLLSLLPNPLDIELSSDLILALLVPPLIFEATLNLKWEKLRQDLVPILLLAIVGTLIGTFIVASIVMVIGRTLIPGVEIPFTAAIAFGALISTTDPVAVLSFFRSLGVAKRLAVLVEGESMFNDGVAIVTFNIAVTVGAAAAIGQGAEAFSIGSAVAEFFKVAFGGLGVGVLLGLFVSYAILKNVDDHLIETATTVALAFGSFVIAERLHLSGILAVVAAGLVVGNIGLQSSTPTTKVTLNNFWEFAAFVVNSLVFLLIGLETDIFDNGLNLIPIIVAVLAVLLSRAVVVYFFTWLNNRLMPNNHIPTPFRHVMYWSGLRGAISLALALSLTGATFGEDVAQELKLMTFGVVLFTLIVQGITIGPLIRFLGLSKKPEQMVQQQRRQARLHAARAGKNELDKLRDEGILPGDVWRAMAGVYEGEINQRNKALGDLLRSYPELEQEIVLQAREDLLQAERSAVADLNRRGLISDQVYHDVIQETDSRAAALELIRSSWGMGNIESKGSEN